jgi:hypothetical protein
LAETNEKPEERVREKVLLAYDKEKVEIMELAMRMIRSGNLLGNTLDYFLYNLSFGRWGNN